MTARTTPTDPDEIYRRMIQRVTRLILLIGIVASIVAAALKGLRFGGGFLLGAFLSWASFWRWKQVVESLGGDAARRRSALIWVLHFAVLFGLAYVIVKYLKVAPAALFIGLLVSAAAVIVSILYEL